MSRLIARCTTLMLGAVVLLSSPEAGAQGFFGGILQGAGRALGVKPIEDLGRNADAEHKRLKDNVVIYKQVEEGASKIIQLPFSLACTATFEAVVGSVRGACSGFGSQSTASSDAAMIDSAKARLVSLGILRYADFSGVSIRWCNGSFNGGGITPNRDEIILSSELKRSSLAVATTIAHEMQHVFQYRKMGTGSFKCEYSQQYVKCGACQDNRHPLENEAYTFENYAYGKLVAAGESASQSSSLSPPNSLRALYSTNNVAPLLSAQAAAPVAKVLSIEDHAKMACSVNGEVKGIAVDSCIEDLSIVYDELQYTIDRDLEDDILSKSKDYIETSENDRRKACSLIATNIANAEIGKSKVARCLLRTNTFIRNAVALARSKK